MIESEMSVPAFPNCVCGASALGAIANAEYELVKSLWETRKLTDTEAVRLILQIADKLAVALTHSESCEARTSQSEIEAEALSDWLTARPYIADILGSPETNLPNFRNVFSEMVN